MERVKAGNWIEVVGGRYLITAKGSIGIVVEPSDDLGEILSDLEIKEAVAVLFHYIPIPAAYTRPVPTRPTFFIRVEDLKVIDEETAMKKIVEGHL